jgi:hypothetical protein
MESTYKESDIEPKNDRPLTPEEIATFKKALIDIEAEYDAVVDAVPLGLYAFRRAWMQMTCRLNTVMYKVK